MSARHVAVLVLYNEHKGILLQHRSIDAVRLPNYWGFFGGGIEGLESLEQALARELLEELEYPVQAPRLIWTQKIVMNGDEVTKYIFVERYDPRRPLIQHEGQDMKWWRIEDTIALKIVDHDRIALERVQEFLDSMP